MCRKPMISGIICEYNPFHNGHRALIEESRRRGSTHIVAVMSGNFVQRGEPACLEKGARARMALACGADLVLELPLPWAMARAETFAWGGVYLLQQLGCVEHLMFGSEQGEIQTLQELAALLESPDFQAALARELTQGVPFARARQAAITKLCNTETAQILEQPNNILGIEYCKALRRLNSSIQPETIQRVGAGHDASAPGSEYASASYLRTQLQTNPQADLSAYMPHTAAKLLRTEAWAGQIASLERLETAMLAMLRTLSKEQLAQLPDISEGLEHRLWRAIRQSSTLDELYQTAKSKRYSHARIRRITLAAFLGLRADDIKEPPPYLRVLGMNPRGREILHQAKRSTQLPIVTKYAEIASLSQNAEDLFALECRATDLFTLSLAYRQACGLEQKRGVIVTELP